MSKHSTLTYLKSIIDAINTIERHQQSGADAKIITDAVVFHLITIGEAASQLPGALHERYPDVNWPAMIAARNRMVHAYLDINTNVIWDIVKNHLPSLRTQIETIIRKEEGNQHG